MMLARGKNGKIGKFVRRMGDGVEVDTAPTVKTGDNLFLSSAGLDRTKRNRARAAALEEAAVQSAEIEAASQAAEEDLQFMITRQKNKEMEVSRVAELKKRNQRLKDHFRQSADFSMFNRAPSGTCLPPMNRRANFDRNQIVPADPPGRCIEGQDGIRYLPEDTGAEACTLSLTARSASAPMGMQNEFPTVNPSHNLERGILPVDAQVSGDPTPEQFECHPFTVRGFQGPGRASGSLTSAVRRSTPLQGCPYVASGIPLDPPWGPYAEEIPARMGGRADLRSAYERGSALPPMGHMGDFWDGVSEFFTNVGDEIVDQAPQAIVQNEIKKQQQYTAPTPPPVVNQYVLPPNANYVQRQAASMGVSPVVLYSALGLLGIGVGLVAYKVIKKG